MEYAVKSGSPEKQRIGCLVVGVYEARRLTPAAEQIDASSDGLLSNLVRRGDMEGKSGQRLLLHNVPNVLADRVLLIGCGRERDLDDRRFQQVITSTVAALNDTGSTEASCYLTELTVKGRDLLWKVRHTVQTVEDCLYRFDDLKSKKEPPRRKLRKIVINVPSRRELIGAEQALRIGSAISGGMSLAKDLGNLPANICTPTYLAERVQSISRNYDALRVKVLEPEAIAELGMGALLSVTRGSPEPARFIIMEHFNGDSSAKPIVLVGKGVTFDSGGISIKQSKGMDEMKFDMCGAAAVIGTLYACAELQLPLNVVGLVPAVEKLPSGTATRPGDVVTSLSGQTIEVLNTDAEGRLILCDALTYAERYEPEAVVDAATLTGACIVALGKHPHGLFSNHAALAHDLLTAGRTAADRAWELPLWDEYQEQLSSNFADMANIGGQYAGAITAACFLARFTKKYHWAHLDIAGTAWLSNDKKGGTGRPVPLLTQFLLDRMHG